MIMETIQFMERTPEYDVVKFHAAVDEEGDWAVSFSYKENDFNQVPLHLLNKQQLEGISAGYSALGAAMPHQFAMAFNAALDEA